MGLACPGIGKTILLGPPSLERSLYRASSLIANRKLGYPQPLTSELPASPPYSLFPTPFIYSSIYSHLPIANCIHPSHIYIQNRLSVRLHHPTLTLTARIAMLIQDFSAPISIMNDKEEKPLNECAPFYSPWNFAKTTNPVTADSSPTPS